MKKIRYALCAAATLAFATPAYSQVITVDNTTTGTPLPDTIHESQSNTTDNAFQVYGSTAQNHMTQDVTFTGSTALQTKGSTGDANIAITDGGGFAFVSDTTGDSTSVYSIIIDPDQLFTDMKLAVQLTGEGTFQIYTLLTGGADYVLYPTTFTTDNKGNTNYLIDVTGGTFDAIQIVSSGASIFELKQISINQAIPEPGTWALMLLGFGAIGWTMRRYRTADTIPQVA